MAISAFIEVITDPTIWIAAFAGGAFGASIGALPAFVFTGFMVIAGEMAGFTEANMAGNVTALVGFGPVFGPHISFAGGVAAAAYAANKGYMDFGFDYHEGKNITAALGTRPDVLVVGGVFGILGMLIRQFVEAGLTGPIDAIALTVVLSALIARVAFGYELIGTPRGDGYFDMTPFEREEMRTTMTGDKETGVDPATDGGVPAERLAVEPWLPQQYRWSWVATLGVVAGILGGYLYVITGSMFLGFGISAASLLFLNLGVEEFPVTHHITIVASAAAAAAMASGNGIIAGVDPWFAVVVAAVFGAIAALFGEAFQRVFYAHGDTHVDPPAAAIAFGSLVIAVLYLVGVFGGAGYVPTALLG